MKISIINGQKYITNILRGVEYTLMRNGDGWGVATKRLALGRFNPGGFKTFKTLADVKLNCKAFENVDLLNAI